MPGLDPGIHVHEPRRSSPRRHGWPGQTRPQRLPPVRDCFAAAFFGHKPEIMPYVAGITVSAGSTNVFEDFMRSFASAFANIRKRAGQWIIESSSFDACDSHEAVYSAAKELSTTIHTILSIYMGFDNKSFAISSTMKLTDDDKLIDGRAYGVLRVNVVRPASEVFPSTASGSLATDVLSRMATDPAIAEALSLVGHEGTDWPRDLPHHRILRGRACHREVGLCAEIADPPRPTNRKPLPTSW